MTIIDLFYFNNVWIENSLTARTLKSIFIFQSFAMICRDFECSNLGVKIYFSGYLGFLWRIFELPEHCSQLPLSRISDHLLGIRTWFEFRNHYWFSSFLGFSIDDSRTARTMNSILFFQVTGIAHRGGGWSLCRGVCEHYVSEHCSQLLISRITDQW